MTNVCRVNVGGRVFLLNSNTSTIRSGKKATNLLATKTTIFLIHSLKFLSAPKQQSLSFTPSNFSLLQNNNLSPARKPYLFNLYANGFPLPLLPSPLKASCCSHGLFRCLPLFQEQNLRHHAPSQRAQERSPSIQYHIFNFPVMLI